jgi:hypothetical protein
MFAAGWAGAQAPPVAAPAEKQEIRVYALRHASAPEVARVVRELFSGAVHRGGPSVTIGTDPRTNSLILSGTQHDLDSVEAVLQRLDSAASAEPPEAPDLSVRVFWVVGSPRREEGSKLEEFQEAGAELRRLGLDRPRLAAQLSVATQRGAPFETTGVAVLDEPCRLSVAGSLKPDRDGAKLEMSVTVHRAVARQDPGPLVCRLRSRVTIRVGRPVVLGSAPVDGRTSAFVIELERRESAAAPKKATAFEFRQVPWARVFEWLSDRTGLPVLSAQKPTGTFTFVSPQPGKTYTVPEVVDILNEALLGQHFLLVRRERSFTVVPADERIDPTLVPRVRPEELESRGRTELVSLVVTLKSSAAEDLAPEVKKLLGPFGDVLVLKTANRLVLQDTAGNLRRVYATLLELEQGDNRKK